MILRHTFQKILTALPPLFAAFFIHSALGAAYVVPSASMEPTLEIGDEIVAVVPYYGWGTASLPFAGRIPALPHLRIFNSLPHRGDVVVSARQPIRMKPGSNVLSACQETQLPYPTDMSF